MSTPQLDTPFLRDLEAVLRRHGRKLDVVLLADWEHVGWEWHNWLPSDELVLEQGVFQIACGDCGFSAGKHHPLCCWAPPQPEEAI